MPASSISWGREGKTKVPILCHPQWVFAEQHKAPFIPLQRAFRPSQCQAGLFCFPPRRFDVVAISRVFIRGSHCEQRRLSPGGRAGLRLPVWGRKGRELERPSVRTCRPPTSKVRSTSLSPRTHPTSRSFPSSRLFAVEVKSHLTRFCPCQPCPLRALSSRIPPPRAVCAESAHT